MKNIWKSLVLSIVGMAPFALTGCTPAECANAADCADKAQAQQREFTCSQGVCKAGLPFVTGGGGGTTGGGTGGGDDAGSTGGGGGGDAGSTGGGTGTGGGSATGGGGGTTRDAGPTDLEIVAVRAAADTITDGGAVGLTITGALVTYLKPLAADAGNSDPAGFFIQGDSAALFVAIDPATVAGGPFAVGDIVDLTVQTVAKSGGLRTVVAVTGATKSSSGNPVSGLTASVDAVDFLTAGQLDTWESRLISLNGSVVTEPAGAGGGYKSVNVNTSGTPDAGSNMRLRLPSALMEAQFFGPGCTFMLTGTPMWRFNAVAQPSSWLQSELTNIVCPGPSVLGANASSSTAVSVNFSRDLNGATIAPAAFTITSGSGALAVSAATVSSARSVSLTTAAQTDATVYTVTVDNTVTDARGTSVPSTANSTTFTGTAGAVCAPGVVISAVFGGNGTGSAFNQDFVELHNRTSAAVSLAGWSIQYQSATGTTWAVVPLTGSIAAGGYHLVGLASSTNGTAIPTPDTTATGTNLSGTNGKIALASSTTALAGTCAGAKAAAVDFFGYGSADCFLGTVNTALSTSTGATRNGMGCANTNVSSADFTTGTPAAPKNSASTANQCTCP